MRTLFIANEGQRSLRGDSFISKCLEKRLCVHVVKGAIYKFYVLKKSIRECCYLFEYPSLSPLPPFFQRILNCKFSLFHGKWQKDNTYFYVVKVLLKMYVVQFNSELQTLENNLTDFNLRILENVRSAFNFIFALIFIMSEYKVLFQF